MRSKRPRVDNLQLIFDFRRGLKADGQKPTMPDPARAQSQIRISASMERETACYGTFRKCSEDFEREPNGG